MPQPTHDESQLVERACRGEVEADGELVRRHQDQALATAYMLLRDRQEGPGCRPGGVHQGVPGAGPLPPGRLIQGLAAAHRPQRGPRSAGGEATPSGPLFGVDAGAGPTRAVSRQELVETLAAQGVPVRSTDEAISSVELVCGPAGSGYSIEDLGQDQVRVLARE